MIVCAEMSVDSDRELESGDEKESVVRRFITFIHCNIQALFSASFLLFVFFLISIQMKILIKTKMVTIIS